MGSTILIDWAGVGYSTIGLVASSVEVAAGAAGLIVSGALTGSGFGTPAGVAGAIASGGLVAHGAYGFADSLQGLQNALEDTNHPGPLAQLGGFLFGDDGLLAGYRLDQLLSIRGAAQSLHNLFGNGGNLSDMSALAKFLDRDLHATDPYGSNGYMCKQ
ncbi:hypothetical protein [Saccharospirillum impatiens]|uniref:hypothetical protein n=1 Tax=Saccharospirillum impatiens TaxID=169438 RepID=UPI00049089C5|nr:hypothetical protein [Saccharospirillum impatiens]